MCEKCDDKGYIVFGPDTETGREMALCDCQKKKKGGDDTGQGLGEKTPQKALGEAMDWKTRMVEKSQGKLAICPCCSVPQRVERRIEPHWCFEGGFATHRCAGGRL